MKPPTWRWRYLKHCITWLAWASHGLDTGVNSWDSRVIHKATILRIRRLHPWHPKIHPKRRLAVVEWRAPSQGELGSLRAIANLFCWWQWDWERFQMTNHDIRGGGRRGRWKERHGNRYDRRGDNNVFSAIAWVENCPMGFTAARLTFGCFTSQKLGISSHPLCLIWRC